MPHLDKTQNLEQYRNIYLYLYPDFAARDITAPRFRPYVRMDATTFSKSHFLEYAPCFFALRRRKAHCMKPDIEAYRKYVDHFDIPEEQKIEFIHTVWRMMESFVDRAFGEDSVQLSLASKAKNDGQESGTMLSSDKPN